MTTEKATPEKPQQTKAPSHPSGASEPAPKAAPVSDASPIGGATGGTTGELVVEPAEDAKPAKIAFADHHDGTATVLHDVWERVYAAGSRTASHVLRFHKGARVPRQAIDEANKAQDAD